MTYMSIYRIVSFLNRLTVDDRGDVICSVQYLDSYEEIIRC